jgi:hypothetical protein
MNTRNMPNMAKALSGSLDQNTIRALMQSLGNCAQPLSHSGGMTVGGPITFGGSKNLSSGDYRGGDVHQNIYGDDNRAWNANDNRQFIQNFQEYLSTYQNIYNEGDVWNQYNDNSVWDMSSWSRTTNYNMSTHITHGDQFSFPTTNYSETYNFTEGNTITFEGPVTHKNLTVHEGDTIMNFTEEGDTYNITNEGDTYNENHTHINETNIENTYEGDEHYHTHVTNKFVTEITQNIVNEITNQHTHIHQYFNEYITNIFMNGPNLPRSCVGPVMNQNSPLNVEVPTHSTYPTYTLSQGTNTAYEANISGLSGTVNSDCTITFDGTITIPIPDYVLNKTDSSRALEGSSSKLVNGKQGAMICGPGLGVSGPT